MMSNAVINRSSRAAIEKYLNGVLSTWVDEWFQSDSQLDIGFNDDLWMVYEKAPDDRLMAGPSSILLSTAEHCLEALCKLAIKYDGQTHSDDSDFWHQLQQKLWASLLERLLGKHAQQFEQKNSGTFQPALSITLALGEVEMRLSMDKKTFDLLGLISKPKADNTQSLGSLHEAIKGQSIPLSASLKPLNITLKDILELKKGDVIKLDHGLRSPIIVETTDGQAPLGAFLVKQNNSKALLITGKENE